MRYSLCYLITQYIHLLLMRYSLCYLPINQFLNIELNFCQLKDIFERIHKSIILMQIHVYLMLIFVFDLKLISYLPSLV